MMFDDSQALSPEDEPEEALFDGEGRALFRRLVRFASRPKRVASHFVSLAARGWQAPARLFFGMLYYPLVERRSRNGR